MLLRSASAEAQYAQGCADAGWMTAIRRPKADRFVVASTTSP
jgi:hypothetical protein